MEQFVKISTRKPAEPAVTLTQGAVSKVRQLLIGEDDSSLALRMAVRPGGCSGFSYEMYFDSEVGPGDTVEDFDGVGVVVDDQSVELLRGSVLDYQDGLMGSGVRHQQPQRQPVLRMR